ncbi:MAG: immunoglobulin domain-containing protein [Ignavibacteria bacterium]|nr:immunoglobulin domain-containing protein [Ignavibacteria bacterium]
MKKLLFSALFLVFVCSYLFATPVPNELLARKSIIFVENKGQIVDQYGKVNKEVQFVAQVDFGIIVVKNNTISFTFIRKGQEVIDAKSEKLDKPLGAELGRLPEGEKIASFDIYRVDMKVLNANLNPRFISKEMQPDWDNYYLPHCPDGITFVRRYATVVMEEIYPGIDFVLYGNKENKFQYDFVLKPGADPRKIAFKFEGATDVQITDNGTLKVTTPLGTIEQAPPIAYQLPNLDSYVNSRELSLFAKQVESKFVKNSDGVISFFVENYDQSKPLIIDPPTRLWGTYYGGSSTEIGYAIHADVNGNSYITGYCYSTNNIATSGAFQTTLNTTPDAFLVRFNANGVRQWGTYYGGNSTDYGFGLSSDNFGNVYLGGYTYSTNVIASSNGHQTTISTTPDCFLAKFDANGVRQWGTYYGGDNTDICYSCAADGSGNAYLLGYYTYSTNNIATSGAHQTSLSSTPDGFLVKFNTNGVRQWGTYYGGNSSDYCFSVYCDGSGNVYFGGYTYSSTNIVTSGAHQTTLSTTPDCFVVKFNTNGVRQWGTYYGGNNTDLLYSLFADNDGNVYFTGYTYSTDAIVTSGAYQTTLSTTPDAYAVKLNTNGVRQWGTYYGGNNSDYGMGIAADGSGNVYVGGYTYSSDRIASPDGFKTTLATTPDAWLALINPDGRSRKWGTYYGGNNTDLIYYNCVRVDGQGNPFIGGYTYSTDIDQIATSNGHQYSYSGTPEAFLVKFQGEVKQNDAGIVNITSPVDKFDSYQPQQVKVMLRNFGKHFRLTSVTINWSVNGVTQTPFNWTGNLDTGQTVEVVIHPSYRFIPQAPWGPFVVRAWTSNPRGPDANANNLPDGDPTNDAFTKNITPILNDAGFLNADGMLPIEPGVNVVKLRIRNYAPKPLTYVRINWWVNGVQQTPFDWNGNLAAQDSIDVAVGTYDFGTANLPFYIKAATQFPNGFPDDNPDNDERTVVVYKALAGGTYTIGGRNPDFNTLIDFTSYISYWGIAGPVTLKLRPGTYDGGVLLQPVGYRQFPITFESFTGRNDDVIIQFTPTSSSNNFVVWIDRLSGVTFRNLTLRNNSCTWGNVIRLTGNIKGLTIENCTLIGCQNPAKTTTFALIISDNSILDNFKIVNSTLRNGSVGIYLMSPTGTNSNNMDILNNIFVGQNWYGAYLDGLITYNFNDNTISGINLVYGIFVNSRNLGILTNSKDDLGPSPLATGNVFSGNRISGLGPATSTALNNPNAGISVQNGLSPVVISGNTIMATNTNGIFVSNVNSVTISNNQFTQSSTGSFQKGSIVLFNSGAQNIMIDKNFVTNSNTRGIYLENSLNSKIYKNIIKLSGGNYGLHLLTSSAIIANNIVSTLNSGALFLDRVTNTWMVYNSYVGTNSGPIAYLNSLGSGNFFKRNMIYNRGTGNAIQIAGTAPTGIVSDENNIYTAGSILVSGIFGNIANLQAWRNVTGLDRNSSSVAAEFLSDDNPRVAKINRSLYYTYPIAELGPLSDEIEKFDIDGNPRNKAFYIGVNTLNPVIRITTPPKEVINCVGSTGNFFSVVAEIDFGGTLSYQWYYNDREIPGATEAIYSLPPLKFEMGGVYKCRITGNGEADPVWTDPVLLYAVEKTQITRQPKVVYATTGSVATFEIDVHITPGDNPLLQPKVRWYRGTTPLVDNDRIAGTNSSIMTIRDLRPADFGGNYIAIVEGLCGRDTSDPISLAEKPRIVAQPLQDKQVCEGEDVTITVNASSTVSGFTLKYQWKFNGVDLEEGGKYSGVNTPSLTITNVNQNDAGLYSVAIEIEGFDKTTVGPITLAVFKKPQIVSDLPATYQVNTGQPIILTIGANGDNLSYQWYKNNQELNFTGPSLEITSAKTEDAGTYKVKVYNQCGEVWSKECVVSVTFKTILDVPGEFNDVQLFQNKPNPFENISRIEFFLPERGFARVTLSNLLGDVNINLLNSELSAGLHTLEVNAEKLNLSSGVYIYTLEYAGKKFSKRLIVNR